MLLCFSASAYNIKLEITNCPDFYIYLGAHRGPDFQVIDSLPAQNGIVIFKSEKKLPSGVYFIVIPPQSRFDFILADEQNITIKTDARDILGKLSISGEKQYMVFANLQQDIARINKFRSQLNMELEFYKSFMPDTVKFVQLKLDSLNLLQTSLYTTYKNRTQEGTFLNKLLSVMIPFAAPSEMEVLRYTDPATHYEYYKKHYLDRIDFTDASILNSPEFVFHKQLEDYCFYFFDTRINQPETVYPDIDSLIAKTNNNPEFRQYILSYLIARYENPSDLRLEALLVYVYRNYYLVKKPDWVSDQAYAIMKFRIGAVENNVIGNLARDLNLPDSTGEYHSIYEMYSEYKVLLFWEPDCDICNETALILSGQYPKLLSNNIDIYAVLTNSESEEWSPFIQENALDWTNVYDPDRSSNFETYYGTYKTPRIYILDSDNKIIGKDIKPESIFEFIQNYKNKQIEDRNRFNFIFGN
jgi:peroxiredoxin